MTHHDATAPVLALPRPEHGTSSPGAKRAPADGPSPSGAPGAPSSAGRPSGTPAPTPCAAPGPAVRLTVTVRHSEEALGRLASTLRATRVRELSYAVSGAARATAVVVVPRADAGRAGARLRRLVDVLAVAEAPAGR
ncbi:hypothetical protein [Streptomyces sp. SHP 1-2]|uniref:hypothetical protein n=1 Tax=Streptomyces sp. SHP 1-2 TaxID=2769489 RepID=UPI0022383235|nr:hypothetical protein [Streptomyces sp. SHP 1-2]MCW5250374.1 hypothetical protein [Streptomyces sp. SHP 1-2]